MENEKSKKIMYRKPDNIPKNITPSEITVNNSINGLPLGAYVTNIYEFWRKGYDGSGVIIGIIDDGVNANHPALIRCPDKSKKVLGQYTFVSGGRTPNATAEHGTAVAGLVAGWSSDGYRGMAPNSKLYSFNVFDTEGDADPNDIVSAVHKAIELGCHVINMSLGSPDSYTRLHNVVKRAFNFNIPCVCSAGNSGPDTVEYPAAYPECISVGSVRYSYSSGNIAESSFSSTNTEVDCCAVGENVLLLNAQTDGYMYGSGTSFSTPIVTGFIAVLRHYLLNKRTNVKIVLTVDVIKNAMYANTLDLFELGKDNESGVGFIFRRGVINSPIIVKTFGT
ncbi:subtilase family protein [Catovirus CTV1]|uniref:Subtilase family protein n=1 Tax=Catovirus CTV1 TaxID=1977631 RepID=A0A1V0SBG2_9VIRU|nr:subtilase family protein [Catovirus CTV1]